MSARARMPEPDQDVEVQDNRREESLRELFGLRRSEQGRMGADAVDETGHEFELKSTTKNSVSTARDVGPHTVRKWRTRYWLFAKGRNLASGFKIDETYFLHPNQMDAWFRKLEDRFAGDLKLLKAAAEASKKEGATSAEVARLTYLGERGLTLNNPKVPWEYVQAHGKPITSYHAKGLRALVRRFPLKPASGVK